MKDFMLGFFVAASFAFLSYLIWENKRGHVPVVIQQVPVPVQMIPNMSTTPDQPDFETWDT